MTLSTCPPDALLRIFMHLAPRDLLTLSAVSRATRNAVRSDACWRALLPVGVVDEGVDGAESLYERAVQIARAPAHAPYCRADGARVSFTAEGDARGGLVRVSVTPGNHAVAHMPSGCDANIYFERLSLPATLCGPAGPAVLLLRSVCWLDVQSSFCGLPPGGYTFSWNVRLNADERGRSRIWRRRRALRFTAQVFSGDECARQFHVDSCVLPAHLPLASPGVSTRSSESIFGVLERPPWTRLDLNVEVTKEDTKVLLSVGNTSNEWKFNMLFGGCDAVLRDRASQGDDVAGGGGQWRSYTIDEVGVHLADTREASGLATCERC
jgi:hypothetical protein